MKTADFLLNVAIASLFMLFFPALSFSQGTAPGQDESTSLQDRVRVLEEQQGELYHSLAEKKAAGLASKVTERISLSGLIEIEAGYENTELVDGASDSSSDLVLATVQLGLAAVLTENIHSNIILFHEEDGADLEVDEAALDLDFAPLFGRIGRIYVPFGVYNSHFISDPLTLELGETRETAALIGYGHDYFSVSFFLFNGDVDKAEAEDQISDWGGSLVFTPLDGLEFGASYLSDLADSNAELLSEYQRRVGGYSAFVSWGKGQLEIFGEIVGASRAFAASDLDGNGDGAGDQPLAWNLELAWDFDPVEVAIRYEGSEEFFGQPESQYGLAAHWSPWEHNALSVEYSRGEFDRDFGKDEEGNSLDTRDLLAAQWAVEF